MKTLQEEAELKYPFPENKRNTLGAEIAEGMQKAFIAGANSEHVRREKIQYAIEQLKIYYDTDVFLHEFIQELENQLL